MDAADRETVRPVVVVKGVDVRCTEVQVAPVVGTTCPGRRRPTVTVRTHVVESARLPVEIALGGEGEVVTKKQPPKKAISKQTSVTNLSS